MTLDEFRASLDGGAPPSGLTPPLAALWHEANGAWDAAHKIVQAESSPESAWVHAYLHRMEGDLSNAAYWYRRAERSAAKGEFTAEWTEIASALLADADG